MASERFKWIYLTHFVDTISFAAIKWFVFPVSKQYFSNVMQQAFLFWIASPFYAQRTHILLCTSTRALNFSSLDWRTRRIATRGVQQRTYASLSIVTKKLAAFNVLPHSTGLRTACISNRIPSVLLSIAYTLQGSKYGFFTSLHKPILCVHFIRPNTISLAWLITISVEIPQ